MKLLIFFLIILSFNNISSKNFPDIYGCFCEGGIITGKISEEDILKINEKKNQFV